MSPIDNSERTISPTSLFILVLLNNFFSFHVFDFLSVFCQYFDGKIFLSHHAVFFRSSIYKPPDTGWSWPVSEWLIRPIDFKIWHLPLKRLDTLIMLSSGGEKLEPHDEYKLLEMAASQSNCPPMRSKTNNYHTFRNPSVSPSPRTPLWEYHMAASPQPFRPGDPAPAVSRSQPLVTPFSDVGLETRGFCVLLCFLVSVDKYCR